MLIARRASPKTGPRERRYTRDRRMSPGSPGATGPDRGGGVASGSAELVVGASLGTPGFYVRVSAASPRATSSQVRCERGPAPTRQPRRVRRRAGDGRAASARRRSAPGGAGRRGRCRGSRRGHASRAPAGRAHGRGRRGRASSEPRRARSVRRGRSAPAWPARPRRRRRRGRAALSPAACSRRSRAPRRRVQPTGPCTSLRRRTASAPALPRATRRPRGGPAPR